MTNLKVVWLPNETDYSYCEFVVPNTPFLLNVKEPLVQIAPELPSAKKKKKLTFYDRLT